MRSRPPFRRGAVLALLAAFAVAAGARAAPRDPASGRVVWESNRSGAFRIWSADLDGAGVRRLTPDEPGRDHCCARLSPDGARVAYLSMPAESRRYLPATAVGELRLRPLDGDDDERVLSKSAHHMGAHRAAVWWSATELVYLASDGSTRKIDLALGREEVVQRGEPGGAGWLIAPGGRFATSDDVTFSDRDPESGRIRLATPLGGCEPTFSADGELGLWVAGAGGPIDVIDLATRATRSILRKNDPRLPASWRYLYFPALSPDRTRLAWAASNGDHDHFRSDYDVFVATVDPENLELTGPPRRIAPHPAVDRYPDVWRLAPPRPPRFRETTAEAPARAPATPPPVFLWDAVTAPNRREPAADSEQLTRRGATWADPGGRLVFAGGHAEASPESADRVAEALQATNAFSLALLVEPGELDASTEGPLVALTRSPRDRGFVLEQVADRLELRLRTGRPGGGGAPESLFALADRSAVHVTLAFSPGRLAVYRDGALVERRVVAGDFFHWKVDHLLFAAEAGAPERFRGTLSHLRIWDRELDAEEVRSAAGEARGALPPPVPERLVSARLRARSRPPTLDEISPYRQALLVEEYERADGGGDRARWRVVRWALLDGARTAPLATPLGAVVTLRLVPFASQPQLEGVVLADTLPPSDLQLDFSVTLDDG